MTLDIHQILKLLPHRYPFLLVDRVLEMEKGKRITALIDGARFKRPVEPGDQLTLEVEIERMKAGISKFKGRALVGSELACEATLMCAMRQIN
jgi:3-hydroxyacyl-[acyl-carrier-protein] dehydratase